VEGPDGASQEEVLNQIKAYKQSSTPKQESYVQPGNVDAARKKLGVQGNVIEGFKNDLPENQVRERLGIINEAASGIGQTIGNIANVANPEAYQGVVDNPIVGAGLGALRAASSPMAPAANLSARIGEDMSSGLQKLGFEKAADVVGALGMSTADVLTPFSGAGYVRNMVKGIKGTPAGERLLKSSRMRAKEAEEALVQTEKAGAEKLTKIQQEIAQGKRYVEEIADEQKATIPTAQELKAKFAKDAPLGKEAGESWQEGYMSKLGAEKKRFNAGYEDKLMRGSQIEAVPEGYAAAGGKIREAMGVTGRPSMGAAEGVAKKIQSSIDMDAFEQNQYQALRKQFREADPSDKDRVKGIIDEYIKNNDLPELPTVRDLIFERQRLKAGQRAASGDYAKSQFGKLIGGLNEDIAKADATLAKDLFALDNAYKNEFIPYFGKGSLTRAISEGDPAAVVDRIFQPTLTGGRVGTKSRAEEAITKARELIPNEKQWEGVKKAFTNKLIENSMEGGVLNQKKLVKEWGKYLDPAGSNNAVLRKGLGERDFQSMQSVINQLQRSTPESIDAYAKQLTKGLEQSGKVSAKTAEAATKVTRDKLVAKIAKETGADTETVTKRLQSIGSGVFVSGLMRGATTTMLQGGGLVVGSQAIGALLGTVKGRNVFKAMLRSAPGTSQRAAHARVIQQLIGEHGEEDDG
jgi:DNA-binding phage protein/murein DD-endopeptidase MepM/ murein hydrolase activator NlpD